MIYCQAPHHLLVSHGQTSPPLHLYHHQEKKDHRSEGQRREQGPRAELSPAPTHLTQEAVTITCFQITSAVPSQEWTGAQTGLSCLLVNAGISFFTQTH